jgi:hypothetical protein
MRPGLSPRLPRTQLNLPVVARGSDTNEYPTVWNWTYHSRYRGRQAEPFTLGASRCRHPSLADSIGELRLQANAIIDSHVFREGDPVDIGFAPADCVLLGEDDRRLV